MASVKLGRYEATQGQLPRVCVRCGAPAALVKAKNFSWHPGWVLALILVGLLPYVIVALALTKRMRVRVPLCQQHRYHWASRTWLILGGFVFLLALGVGLIALLAALERRPGAADNVGGMLCLGLGVLGLVWLIAAAVAQSTGIRPTEITATRIKLVGVSPGFVEAVDEWREAEEGDEDMGPRRPRRRQAGPGQFYDPDAPRRPAAAEEFYDPEALPPEKPRRRPPGEEL